MCGIIAYLGKKPAYPIIINGLKRLEYRGYDSAGIALVQDTKHVLFKKKGNVKVLEQATNKEQIFETVGIGHTRWATHGEPSDVNAHPHISNNGKLALIHNGIIENYVTLKSNLQTKGYTFQSETDTEVLVNFIENVHENSKTSLQESLRLALSKVVGAYAMVLISTEEPKKLIIAKKGSPIVIGLGDKEYFIASDPSPIIEYTDKVIYLNDEEIAVVTENEYFILNDQDVLQIPYIQKLDLKLESIEKAEYDHFMLKEIFEQPQSIRDCMRGRLNISSNKLVLGGIRQHINDLVDAERVIIVACGTSWHAGLVAEYIFEDISRTVVEVEYASEFRYRNPVIKKGDIVIAISQSGETADTLAAVELAKSKGAIVLGIVNTVGSSISRASHEGAYLHAGPEIGVASTKAFTAQLIVLYMIVLRLAIRKQTITEKKYIEYIRQLEKIPDKIEQALSVNEQIKKIAIKFKNAQNFLYLGRGYNFPVALEGALKLKEISYIHAEGYPAAEMKHGPIALVDENMPVVVIATRDGSYDKIVTNIQEVKARKGVVIAIVTEGDVLIPKFVDHTIEVPKTHETLMPLVSVIPLQLLSYYIAVNRGVNVDQPRNLAKSVTVE